KSQYGSVNRRGHLVRIRLRCVVRRQVVRLADLVGGVQRWQVDLAIRLWSRRSCRWDTRVVTGWLGYVQAAGYRRGLHSPFSWVSSRRHSKPCTAQGGVNDLANSHIPAYSNFPVCGQACGLLRDARQQQGCRWTRSKRSRQPIRQVHVMQETGIHVTQCERMVGRRILALPFSVDALQPRSYDSWAEECVAAVAQGFNMLCVPVERFQDDAGAVEQGGLA